MAYAKLDLRDIDFDLDGHLNAGGLTYSYAGSTTTPLDTYADATGTPNSNPIVRDSSGQAHIWLLEDTAYKFVFKKSDGTTLYTENGIIISSGAATTGSLYVDAEFEFPGGPPVAATAGTTLGWIGGRRVARAISYAANFGGSYGFALTAPTASFVMTVRKNATLNNNGTQIGTITVATNGTYTFATTTGAVQSLAIGDTLHVFGPAVADVTMADFGFTLAGTLV